MGNKFPQWLINLSKLEELRIEGCKRCSELPSLGQLPSLKILYLIRLDNIRFIGDEFYGITANEEEEGRSRASGSSTRRQKFFPALEELTVVDIENLAEWKDADQVRSATGEAEADVFPVLRNFRIRDCPQLTTIPTQGRFPSLDVLEIKKNCHVLLAEKVLSNIANLSSLELSGGHEGIESLKLVKRPESSLSIDGCNSLPTDMLERLCLFPTLLRVELRGADNITTLRGQKGLLKSLQEFTVNGCDALTRLPVEMFESCTSLRVLNLVDCPNLVSFPLDLQRTPSLESFSLFECPNLIAEMPSGFGYLTSLKKVQIGPFSDVSVIEFDWAGLASSPTLRHVFLWGMPDMKSLPHQLQCLTTITSLCLIGFEAIEALPDWLGNFAYLEDLILYYCLKLEYLPKDAMKRLKLRRLEISYCPLLTERCTPRSGSEWPKISNITELEID
ncbi:protein SUPPRESSOR OF npr1-1, CONSTITUTIVE 1-like [Coffea arabica]|uniref:Protein SUPPRESSOR OF npr1-1, CONSTITUTIVE 1-like n=1 Tax=Coffea arabica TaxID=13443 RepID=A0ABM4VXW7_COFAR